MGSRKLFLLLFCILIILNIIDIIVTMFAINQYGIEIELNIMVKNTMTYYTPIIGILAHKWPLLLLPIIEYIAKNSRERAMLNAGTSIAIIYYTIFMYIFHTNYIKEMVWVML